MSSQEKGLSAILITLFSVLLIGTVVYYEQRMLFIDPGFIVFNIINTKTFVFSEYRYGAFITQIVPLAGVLLGGSLKTILIAYSASFNAFYLIVVLVLIFRYKQLPLALLMACYFTLMVSDEFFWPNNEVHQGIGWMFLFLGLYQKCKGVIKFWQHILLILFGFLAIFSHFIVIIPLSFLWLLQLIDRDQKLTAPKTYAFYALLLTAIFLVKYRLGVHGWYDGGKLEGVKTLDMKKIGESFTSGHSKTILPLFLTNYWGMLLLLVVGTLFSIWKKYYLILIVSLGYVIGYYVLLCITYPDAFGKSNLFYIESEWMALSIVVAAILAFKVWRVMPQYANWLFVGLFLVRLGYMFVSANVFEQRLNATAQTVAYMEQQGITKAIILKNAAMESDFLMSWGAPVESLYYSILHNRPVQRSFRVMDEQEIVQVSADTFLSCFTTMPLSALNADYFAVDSLQTYKVINYAEIESAQK